MESEGSDSHFPWVSSISEVITSSDTVSRVELLSKCNVEEYRTVLKHLLHIRVAYIKSFWSRNASKRKSLRTIKCPLDGNRMNVDGSSILEDDNDLHFEIFLLNNNWRWITDLCVSFDILPGDTPVHTCGSWSGGGIILITDRTWQADIVIQLSWSHSTSFVKTG
jgi:hypothetical protein